MQDAGLIPEVIFVDHSSEIAIQLRTRLRDSDRPVGVFAYDEGVATACYRTFRENGATMPDFRLTTVAWQHVDIVELLNVPHVLLPARKLGQTAFQLLLDYIKNKKAISPRPLRGRMWCCDRLNPPPEVRNRVSKNQPPFEGGEEL
jgi:DNA-binding LacI/PurR family transcriptional regulator